MPHELDWNAEGNAAMFSVRQTPWHREGTLLSEAPTLDDARRLGGLDFEVEVRPLFTRVQQYPGVPNIYGYRQAATACATVRTDREDVLGIVSERYQPLQNRDAYHRVRRSRQGDGSDASRQPEISFEMDTLEFTPFYAGGLRIAPAELPPETGGLGMRFILVQRSDTTSIVVQYRSEGFYPAEVRRLLEAFRHIASSMVEAPNTRISQLHILHQSDISAIAVAAGDQDQHPGGRLAERAGRTPEQRPESALRRSTNDAAARPSICLSAARQES